MKIGAKFLSRPALSLAAGALSIYALTAPVVFAATPTPGSRTPQQIVGEMALGQKTINDLLGKENAALKTPETRASVAPKLIPVVHQMRADLQELSADEPRAAQQIAGSQMQLLALLSVLGEKDATDQISSMAANADPSQAPAGQAHKVMERFYVSDNSTKTQTALVDDLEKLDRAHPESGLLTQLTVEIGHQEASPAIHNRLLQIATDVMQNPLAAALREQATAREEAQAQDALLANKPITLSGKLVNGDAFSTDSLKGKVVLVDFWATWCGPCKAELPRVKKMYDEYHSKGLEVLGVSNDYDVDALKGFIASAQMPWPQLFDANAAANHDFNSVTKSQKIDGIPVMYLIDKKGVLRTVNARANMEELIPKLLAEGN